MVESCKVLLGTLKYAEAQRLKTKMAERGVALDIIHNGATCSSGCAVQLEVWAEEADLPQVAALLEQDRQRIYAGLEFDPKLLDVTFDADSAEATCPACATVFATMLGECPDCGLVFSLPHHS